MKLYTKTSHELQLKLKKKLNMKNKTEIPGKSWKRVV